jgi:hypothetical protein
VGLVDFHFGWQTALPVIDLTVEPRRVVIRGTRGLPEPTHEEGGAVQLLAMEIDYGPFIGDVLQGTMQPTQLNVPDWVHDGKLNFYPVRLVFNRVAIKPVIPRPAAQGGTRTRSNLISFFQAPTARGPVSRRCARHF